MFNLKKIRILANEHKISIRELSNKIGITEQGLQKIMRENSTKTETLEKISKIFEVPMSYFLDENLEDCKQKVSTARKTYEIIIQLKVTDEEKEKEILKMVFGNEFIKLLNK